MGRPQDEFCWDNAEKLSDGRWKCKHCNGEFSGTADRIRRHLSGQGGGIRRCEKVPPNIRERASEEVSNKLSTIDNISKRPRLSSPSVGEDYNDGIINYVDRQGAIIGNTTVVAHVTQQLFQGGCSSSARLINVADVADVADVTERRETNEDPNLMTQRDNDDVIVDSRGVMMSNSAAHHPFGPIFARGNQIPQQQGQGSGEPSNDDPQQQEERRQPKYWQTERQTPRDDYSWTKYGKTSTGKHNPRITYRGLHTCIGNRAPPVLPGLRRSSAAANRKEQSSITTSNNTQAAIASSTSPGYFSLGDNPGLDSQGSGGPRCTYPCPDKVGRIFPSDPRITRS